MRLFLVFLKAYAHQLGISEQLNYMHMPDFLLAIFVKFRQNYFGGIQRRKGRGRKKNLPHRSPAPSRKGEVNLNISSKFHTTTQKTENQRTMRNQTAITLTIAPCSAPQNFLSKEKKFHQCLQVMDRFTPFLILLPIS